MSNSIHHQTGKSFSERCIENSKTTALVGLAIMLTGVCIGTLLEINHHNLLPAGRPALIMLWHGLVILGEAIAVLFFIHHVVERKSHESYFNILHKNANEIEQNFGNLISSFDVKSREKILDIQQNFFKAILQGLDYMPYEIVECIHKADYSTNLIRRNLKLVYRFFKEEDGKVIIKQEIRFDLENISGKEDSKEKYDLPLDLNRSDYLEYEIVEITHLYSKTQRTDTPKKAKYSREKIKDGFETKNESYYLKEPLVLVSGEKISVFQFVNGHYNFNNNMDVSDYYFSKFYTINVNIEIQDFPEDRYVFNLFPTSPTKEVIPESLGDNKSYHIPFLLPGQGLFYTITKKNKPELQ